MGPVTVGLDGTAQIVMTTLTSVRSIPGYVDPTPIVTITRDPMCVRVILDMAKIQVESVQVRTQ